MAHISSPSTMHIKLWLSHPETVWWCTIPATFLAQLYADGAEAVVLCNSRYRALSAEGVHKLCNSEALLQPIYNMPSRLDCFTAVHGRRRWMSSQHPRDRPLLASCN